MRLPTLSVRKRSQSSLESQISMPIVVLDDQVRDEALGLLVADVGRDPPVETARPRGTS